MSTKMWRCKECGGVIHIKSEGKMDVKKYCMNCGEKTWYKRVGVDG